MVVASAWIILPYYSWRFLTVVTALPVLLACAVSMWLLPESPRWLCNQRRLAEAEEVVLHAMKVNGDHQGELADYSFSLVVDEASLPAKVAGNMKSNLTELFSPDYFFVTLPLWTIWACFGASYYGIVLFTGKLFESEGNDDDGKGSAACSFDYGSIFITTVAEFIGCVLVVRYVDLYGRVKTQAVAYGFGAAGCLLLGNSRAVTISL